MDSKIRIIIDQAIPFIEGVLEPYAEFVTKTVEEDGIAFAMKHYGLI